MEGIVRIVRGQRRLTSRLCAIALVILATSVLARVTGVAAQSPRDEKREFTVTGCLLRNGYATYKLEGAKVDAVDGKAVKDLPANSPMSRLTVWNLEGGGNLGARIGEKLQVVGLTGWKEADDAEEPRKPPVLEVKSLKTAADSCS